MTSSENKGMRTSEFFFYHSSHSMEESTANLSSFNIAKKTAFEAKGRLYTTGKVIQRLFIIDLYT